MRIFLLVLTFLFQQNPFIEIEELPYGAVHAIAWSPSGSILAIGGESGLQLRSASGEVITEIQNIDIITVTWYEDMLIASTRENTVMFWRYEGDSLMLEQTFPVSGSWVYSLAYNGRFLAVNSSSDSVCFSSDCVFNHQLRIYDGASGEMHYESPDTSYPVTFAVQHIASFWNNNRLITQIGNKLIMYQLGDDDYEVIDSGDIRTLAVDPTFSYVAFTEGDVTLYDDFLGKQIHVHVLDGSHFVQGVALPVWIAGLDWHLSQNLLASTTVASEIIIWQLHNSQLEQVATLRPNHGQISKIAWDNETTQLAMVTDDNRVYIWQNPLQDYTFPDHQPNYVINTTEPIVAVDWYLNQIVAGSTFYDFATGETTHYPILDGIQYMQFSEDGSRLLAGIEEQLIVYDFDGITFHEVDSLPHPYPRYDTAISDTGDFVVYHPVVGQSSDSGVHLWYPDTGEIVILNTGQVRDILLSPDEDVLLLGNTEEPSGQSFSIAENTYLPDILPGYQPLCCGSGYGSQGLDWQGNSIALNTWGLVKIWRADDLTQHIRLWVNLQDIALSPDGELLAGMGSPNYIYIWDALTGEQLDVYYYDARYLAWSADGQYLLAADDMTIRVWEIIR